jgi:hypothetical protein
MIQPFELQEDRPINVHGGLSRAPLVWQTLKASFDGDLDRLKELISEDPALSTCQYDYTGPLLLAVREGHLELVRALINQGALDPKAYNHPFLNPILTMAEDREYHEIAEFLKQSLATPGLTKEWGDTGGVHFERTDDELLFEKAVHSDDLETTRQLLESQPGLATSPFSSWGEGVLSVPANHANLPMLELLMSYGARVPDMSKWPRAYYFKHEHVAEFLLRNGMIPNHKSWRLVTLLHDMAQENQLNKARLLLDHGAELDAIDEEYRSTPLGLAARWGHRDMVKLLLERGADPHKAEASWATPLAWARKKGHAEIEADLKAA